MDKKELDEAQLRESLGDVAYHVTQEKGTELPFSHPYDHLFDEGIYVDVITKEVADGPLFPRRPPTHRLKRPSTGASA